MIFWLLVQTGSCIISGPGGSRARVRDLGRPAWLVLSSELLIEKRQFPSLVEDLYSLMRGATCTMRYAMWNLPTLPGSRDAWPFSRFNGTNIVCLPGICIRSVRNKKWTDQLASGSLSTRVGMMWACCTYFLHASALRVADVAWVHVVGGCGWECADQALQLLWLS